jgi:prevent-host-death family protein
LATVGVRELKNRLSEYLRRVADSERITVTDRGRPIAVVTSPEPSSDDEAIRAMVRDGLARWGGGKPRGARRPVKLKGGPIHQTVLEGRQALRRC